MEKNCFRSLAMCTFKQAVIRLFLNFSSELSVNIYTQQNLPISTFGVISIGEDDHCENNIST